RGMPFRTAHEVSGRIVRDLYEGGRDFSSLSLSDWQRYDPLFDDRVFAAITPEAAVAARVTPQSTGPKAVAAALEETRRWTRANGQ
ncbi:MAG: argininosuccinate lyase, partial [Vicinamibacterales bacterium]